MVESWEKGEVALRAKQVETPQEERARKRERGCERESIEKERVGGKREREI